MFTKQHEDKILYWIERDIDQLGKYLLSGTIHGKPGVPVAELGRIEKVIKKNFSSEEQYRLAKKLLARPEYTARNIGTHLVASGCDLPPITRGIWVLFFYLSLEPAIGQVLNPNTL